MTEFEISNVISVNILALKKVISNGISSKYIIRSRTTNAVNVHSLFLEIVVSKDT